jgi:hypothetical protein
LRPPPAPTTLPAQRARGVAQMTFGNDDDAGGAGVEEWRR